MSYDLCVASSQPSAFSPVPTVEQYPEHPIRTGSQLERIIADLGARIGSRKPFTVLSAGDSATEVFDTGTLDRLRKLEHARDPHGMFRSNFPILH
ncbi:hypothetical protein [Nocardia sp. CA-145437]|uniref:hypothetical protein n=1 Tax=Nocardia sp. CA-145437 TaxID=3239980 RepID=UPI003D996EF9